MTEEIKPSVQKVVDAKGVQLTIDYFLYSCFEHERTQFAKSQDKCKSERWPLPSDIETKELGDLIKDLTSWYADTYPELENQAPIDYERLAEVAVPLVFLTADMTELVETKTGAAFPSYDKNKGPDELWMKVLSTLTDVFQGHSIFYSQYLQWTHGVDTPEEPEPGSRPPVGKYAPRFRDRNDSRDRPSRDRSPRERSSRERSSRDRPSRDRPPRDKQRDRDKKPARRNDSKTGRGESNSDRSKRLEENALKDILKAIRTLKNDPSVSQVTLAPANSFYRRLQHRCVADQGCFSSSVGEGKERAVSVMMKKD